MFHISSSCCSSFLFFQFPLSLGRLLSTSGPSLALVSSSTSGQLITVILYLTYQYVPVTDRTQLGIHVKLPSFYFIFGNGNANTWYVYIAHSYMPTKIGVWELNVSKFVSFWWGWTVGYGPNSEFKFFVLKITFGNPTVMLRYGCHWFIVVSWAWTWLLLGIPAPPCADRWCTDNCSKETKHTRTQYLTWFGKTAYIHGKESILFRDREGLQYNTWKRMITSLKLNSQLSLLYLQLLQWSMVVAH